MAKTDFEVRESTDQPHEAGRLHLDCSKARSLLKWTPAWDCKTALENTVEWYRTFFESGAVNGMDDIHGYVEDARKQ